MKIPLRKRPTRYQKARRALHEMLPSQRQKKPRPTISARAGRTEHAIQEHEQGFAGLHWMTAGLFLAAGAEAAFGERRGDHRPADAIRWAPFVAAPLAGAVQAARALWPTPATRIISKLVNGVALGVGAAGLASSITHALRERAYEDGEARPLHERIPSVAPLAFGAVGLLGLLLDSEEEEAAEAVVPPAKRIHRRGRVRSIRIRV